MKKTPTPDIALQRLQTLCATSEQCSFDLKRKLMKWGLTGSQSERIIEDLEKGNFVDDERYARAFARYSYRFSRWGRLKIAHALATKKIPRAVISTSLEEEIDNDEYEAIAADVINAKARGMESPLSYENKARLFRFASARGFESSLISRIIRGLEP